MGTPEYLEDFLGALGLPAVDSLGVFPRFEDFRKVEEG
jgi:hypothetical protein